MTQTPIHRKIKKAPVRRLVFCYMCLFVAILFFKNSEATAQWVSRGLTLCTKRLIPSLFPFMVLSSLLCNMQIGTSFFRVLSVPLSKLLGIGLHGTRALLIGWLCGFPVGAKCASSLLGDGYIGKEEYNTLLCVCSTPSPAFLIGSVGTYMLGSPSKGLLLYAVSLISSLCAAAVFCVGKAKTYNKAQTYSPQKSNQALSSLITSAISDAGVSMLNICAFVVFFSAFLGALGGILVPLRVCDSARALIFCFFELTTGIESICALDTPMVLPLISLAVGWSGLSVHFQTMSICGGMASGGARYFAFHALKSALCFAACLLLR